MNSMQSFDAKVFEISEVENVYRSWLKTDSLEGSLQVRVLDCVLNVVFQRAQVIFAKGEPESWQERCYAINVSSNALPVQLVFTNIFKGGFERGGRLRFFASLEEMKGQLSGEAISENQVAWPKALVLLNCPPF
ncbi:MAG: hypothetical protein K0S07_957 [Chlamydiales bacterium]|jgi:hypothetical protein|nr:hypothetical protein [Chlamydiales bacterium]